MCLGEEEKKGEREWKVKLGLNGNNEGKTSNEMLLLCSFGIQSRKYT